MLWYAMTHYHITLQRVLQTTLSDSDLHTKASQLDKRGKLRVNRYALGHLVRSHTPKGWALAPLRDYLIGDATAMILSHLKKVEKGKHESNPPTMPGLRPMTAEEYQEAYHQFSSEIDFPLKPQQEARIEEARGKGQVRVAKRLTKIYSGWAATRVAGDLLRRIDGALPRPIEFTHTEFARGCLLARKGDDYFVLIRLFSQGHHYWKQNILAEGFIDWRTREDISGRKYPGLILPLEFGRDYHEREYLEHGRPQSAKLIVRRDAAGALEFYVHVAFEFTPEAVNTETIMGIDRGAAKLGSATVVDLKGHTVATRLDMEGAAFSAEMARLRNRIADLQKRGYQRGRVFRLRGRKADAIIGEYANRVVQAAASHRSQIALERIDSYAMSRFLTQSQFAKLREKLTYKAERLGLPAPVDVPAAYTSQTCARCGHQARENRPKRDASGTSVQAVFCCVVCGYEANADDNASEIIALRALHQLEEGGKFQKFENFQVWLKGHLGRDGGRTVSASAQ